MLAQKSFARLGGVPLPASPTKLVALVLALALSTGFDLSAQSPSPAEVPQLPEATTTAEEAVPTSGSGGGAEPSLPLEQIRVVALDAGRRAVIRSAGGPFRVVEPGDEIEGARARIVSIGVDKVVVEAVTRDAEPIRLEAWIYLGSAAGETSRVLRLDPRSPVRQPTRRAVYALPENLDDLPSRPPFDPLRSPGASSRAPSDPPADSSTEIP